MTKPNPKSLLVVIVFILLLILPVTFALVNKYFFAPKTEVKQVTPVSDTNSK
jgi:hypothetical protein